jgi:beta-N-acetylhexosaminidase
VATGVSLPEKVGQMVLTGFRGLSAGPESAIASDLVDRHLGGVILFDVDLPLGGAARNIESPVQLQALTGELGSYATPRPFVGIDQEGGFVARLSPDYGFPATFTAEQLGSIDDPATTFAAADAIAATLAGAGVNLNFAPVVDVDVNPNNPVIGAFGRSFSADPAVVTRNAGEFIRAHHERGILCALKHFPGHGSSAGDSHLGFVDVTESWSEAELEPYESLITGGYADMVMAAHVFNATLDPSYPASLSQSTLTGLLRDELGFEGAIVSDDMGMAAIAGLYGFGEAIELAVNAGVDILLYGNNGPGFDEAIAFRVMDHIVSSVQSGAIPESRVDDAYRRIMALKQRI